MKQLIFAIAVLLLPMIGNATVREIQSLNGEWNIVFDDANEGRAAQWHTQQVFQGLEKWAIQVPSCWEELEQDYEGTATYGKVFTVSKGWKNKTVRL